MGRHALTAGLAAGCLLVATMAGPADAGDGGHAFEGVHYSFLKVTQLRNIKKSYDILLDRRVSKAVLHDLAIHITEGDRGRFQRIFMVYYLPGQPRDAAAWATTHFNPKLDVEILGSTIAQHAKLAKHRRHRKSEHVIGVWLDNRMGGVARMTIFRKGGRYYLRSIYNDGSHGTQRLVRSHTRRGTRFQNPGSGGDYYILNRHGNLELWDSMGRITTAKPFRQP